ncbi:MAG TPA: hypothetical protein VHO46_15905 [Bacteroidales bacterium]|nr:hypothetical protein [Bacteroidales bacterium]
MNASTKSDRIISVFFHPVFIPVYGLIIILSSLTPFGILPFQVKKILFLIILINNVLLPASLLPFLMYMNYISTWTMNEKWERTVPLIIASLLYATSAYIIFRFPVPWFLKSFILSVFILSVVLTIINLKWKISLHATGMGALIALIMLLSFRMYSELFWVFVIASALAGVVLTSRLRLNLHSPRQVWYGLSLGYALTSFCLIFLQKLV